MVGCIVAVGGRTPWLVDYSIHG